MAAHRRAIVKPGWIRGIRPELCFEECRSKIAPINTHVSVVVRRLKTQSVHANSDTRIGRRLRVNRSAQEKHGHRKKVANDSHVGAAIATLTLRQVYLSERPRLFTNAERPDNGGRASSPGSEQSVGAGVLTRAEPK